MKLFNLFLNNTASECFFRVRWKIYCPGCGGTRALDALMRGEILQSLKYNPITLLFIVDVLLMAVLYMIDRKKGKYYTAKTRIIINTGFLIFIFVFFVVRNLLLYIWGIDVLGDFS